MFGVSARQFRYPERCRVVRAKEAHLDITLTISIPGRLRVWRSWQRFARQCFGGHREKQEKYHSRIEWPVLVGCLDSVRRQSSSTIIQTSGALLTIQYRTVYGRAALA